MLRRQVSLWRQVSGDGRTGGVCVCGQLSHGQEDGDGVWDGRTDVRLRVSAPTLLLSAPEGDFDRVRGHLSQ